MTQQEIDDDESAVGFVVCGLSDDLLNLRDGQQCKGLDLRHMTDWVAELMVDLSVLRLGNEIRGE